jgi:hypothetical protein
VLIVLICLAGFAVVFLAGTVVVAGLEADAERERGVEA